MLVYSNFCSPEFVAVCFYPEWQKDLHVQTMSPSHLTYYFTKVLILHSFFQKLRFWFLLAAKMQNVFTFSIVAVIKINQNSIFTGRKQQFDVN